MLIDSRFGKIIILNGASSAGKSTLCEALQKELDEPFLNFSLDFFMFNSSVLPRRREAEGLFSWPIMRSKLFNGYFNCLSGLATAGNNLLVDYIIESKDQLEYLTLKLGALMYFWLVYTAPWKNWSEGNWPGATVHRATQKEIWKQFIHSLPTTSK